MRRFFVEEVPPVGELVSIKGGEARHALTVLRLGKGDEVALLDGGGGLYEAVICEATRREIAALIKGRIPTPPLSCQLILCQSLLKADRFDYIIEKASELGVTALHPFISQRTVVRPRHTGEKMRRWKELAKAAAKQSGRGIPMQVLEPDDLMQVLVRFAGLDIVRLLLWEKERHNDLMRALKGAGKIKTLVAAVGPEGGFDDSEAEAARRIGFETVSMGERTLRSDTAAVVIAAVVQYETGGLARWGEEEQTRSGYSL